MFDKKIFASRLRELRKRHQETQADLAELLGVKSNQISEMEKASKTTSFDRLCLICEHYQVSADYLLGLRDEENGKKEGNP